MRTPSAYRYGTIAELGQTGLETWTLPPEFPFPPTAPPEAPPYTPPTPGGDAPYTPPIPGGAPEWQEEKKTDWLPIAIVAGAALVAAALVVGK